MLVMMGPGIAETLAGHIAANLEQCPRIAEAGPTATRHGLLFDRTGATAHVP